MAYELITPLYESVVLKVGVHIAFTEVHKKNLVEGQTYYRESGIVKILAVKSNRMDFCFLNKEEEVISSWNARGFYAPVGFTKEEIDGMQYHEIYSPHWDRLKIKPGNNGTYNVKNCINAAGFKNLFWWKGTLYVTNPQVLFPEVSETEYIQIKKQRNEQNKKQEPPIIEEFCF